ncbi:MAG: DNA polymerase III subunit gamma/tau [Patescibacteria group bacterium]|nr:DNA polymerase III subunit gamma/tau [Patescibacteria group bacterium]MDE1988404.1 DNA polymerase III subunit gamma/tau [Patescibacteria group bacterium]MDE2217856.1 DNA polymerase III subunit gamma/tau [Patescibacteria group bacterium]
MNEIALYRKYRPQEFKDVLGQEHIVKVLEGSVELDNISHAYLFAGSKGTGKTSLARIFARAIGCADRDLYEIDAASNRGIDDIRELREAVSSLPFESPRKVYIIDEVHMLTKEAFNALLKTLEEPPKHAVFILATTEMDKLPETIVSRCQVFAFKKPSRKILKELVLDLAKKEGFKLEPSSADLIALLGEGSFRDTQGILQKVISFSKDKKISMEEVEQVAGAPRASLVNDFIKSIEDKNLSNGLEAIKSAASNNIDMLVYLKLILRKMRAILLLRYAKNIENSIKEEYPEEDFIFLKELSAKKESNISSKTLLEFLIAYDSVARANIPELPLELALIKLAS